MSGLRVVQLMVITAILILWAMVFLEVISHGSQQHE
jgi:hypothetical protein